MKLTEFNLEQIKDDRYIDAIKLRLEGFTFFDISKKLNISAGTARNYVYKGASIVGNFERGRIIF